MNVKKKMLSLLLCLAMLISICPQVAFAAGTDGAQGSGETPATVSDSQTDGDGNYLTFSSASAFTLRTKNSTKSWFHTLEYSTDAENWTSWTGQEISSSAEGKLYLRGLYNEYISSDGNNFVLKGTSGISCTGNIETLLNHETVAAGNHPEMGIKAFNELFKNCTLLTTAPELPDPDLTNANYCYSGMFSGCTSLTAAPELPATTLASRCYYQMFQGCTKLRTASAIPAETMAESCCYSMFQNCTSLTAAPEIKAKTMAKECCYRMFYGCTSLASSPALTATTLAESCYYMMFYNCTALQAAPALTATTLAKNCCYSMFQNCTSLTSLPTLPATTLEEGCYQYMFANCSGICLSNTQDGQYSIAWSIPADSNAEGLTGWNTGMFTSTGGTGTFDRNPEIGKTYYLLDVRAMTYEVKLPSDGDGYTVAAQTGSNSPVAHGGSYSFTVAIGEGYTDEEMVVKANNTVLTAGEGGVYTISSISREQTVTVTGVQVAAVYSLWVGDTQVTSVNAKDVLGAGDTGATVIYHADTNTLTLNNAAVTGNTAHRGGAAIYSELADTLTIAFIGTNTLTGVNFSGDAYGVYAENGLNLSGDAEASLTVNAGTVSGNAADNKSYGISCRSLTVSGGTVNVAGTDYAVLAASEPTAFVESPADAVWNEDQSTYINSAAVTTLALTAPVVDDGYYLTFSSDSTFTLSMNDAAKHWNGTLEYSMDALRWNTWDGSTVNSTSDGKLYLRGRNNTFITGSGDHSFVLSGTNIACTGDIATLLDHTKVANKEQPLVAGYAFYGLFKNCTQLVAAPQLSLTTLADYCYQSMFEGCTALAAAPTLPAVTLAAYCYQGMFKDCTALTTAPQLLSETLAPGCYYEMFCGCTSLQNVPELPAETLSSWCYQGMFKNCTTLTAAPTLSSATLANSCYKSMFEGCTSLTAAPVLPAAILKGSCYDSMFKGCTALTAAPELSATTLAGNCYQSMFEGCTALTTAPKLPATILAVNCYQSMFEGCTALTAAPELPAEEAEANCYDSMFKGCTALMAAPELPAKTLDEACYSEMFKGCTALTAAPELPATALDTTCYAYMFEGCTSLTSLPELPATVLHDGCYRSMFYNCSGIQLSETATGKYTIPWSIPAGAGGEANWNNSMFIGTGGTFAGDPEIGKVYYLWDPHTHGDWTYAASGATITATCGAEGCTDPKYTETLTISAPTGDLTYNGTAKEASLSDQTQLISSLKDASIAYAVTDGEALSEAPENAGDYTAGITVGGQTAGVTFTIQPVKLTTPAGLAWNGDKATWNTVDNAAGYMVQLYRDGVTEGDAVFVSDAEYEFSITKPGSYTFKVHALGVSNYADSDKAESTAYVVDKFVPTASNFDFTPPVNLTYDGTAKVAAVIPAAGVTGMGAVTVKYYDASNEEVAAPVDAGTYTVYIDVAEGSDYSAVSGLYIGTFEIGKASLTPVIVDAGGSTPTEPVTKVYDGNSSASGLAIKLNGVIVNDDVSLSNVSFNYDSKDVADASTIYATIGSLTGTDSGNYELVISALPLNVPGKITKCVLTPSIVDSDDENVFDISELTKFYDGTTDLPVGVTPKILLSAQTGEYPTATASFAYEDANAGNRSVVATDITLDEPWRNNYTLSTTTASTQGKIDKNNAAIQAGEGYTLDYIAETIAVTGGYEVSTAQNDGTAVYTGSITDYMGHTLYVRRTETDNFTASDWMEIAVAARPAAPSLTKTDETLLGQQNGKLSGIDGTMEYSLNGGDWTDGSADLTGLASGTTVKVRVKATADAPRGIETTYTIAEGAAITVTFEANGQAASGMPAQLTGLSYGALITKPADPTATNTDFVFRGWYTDSDATTEWNFGTDTVKTKNITLYAKWEQVYFTVGVNVKDHEGNNYTEEVALTLKRGNEIIDSTTGSSGHYAFNKHVEAGIYNIVIAYTDADGRHTKTELITINSNQTVNIQLPAPGVNSHLTVGTDADTPAVMVGGLDDEAASLKTENDSATEVTVSMTVEGQQKAEVEAAVVTAIDKKIQETSSGGGSTHVVEYLDITMTKQIDLGNKENISQTSNVIELVIPFVFDGKSEDSIIVLRYHGTAAEMLTQSDTSADGTYRLDKMSGYIHIYTKKFSTYAIAYTLNTGYTITFDSDDGTSVSTATTNTEGKLTELPMPTRSGYTFDGWYTDDGTKVTVETVFRADTTLTARWTRNSTGGIYVPTYYTLTFDVNGGSAIGSIHRVSGTIVDLTEYIPTRESYEFSGWYSDEELTELVTSVKLTKNTSVYAGWEIINPFSDVATTDWFYDEVMYAYENGLMQGTDNGFEPMTTTNRGMIVTILYRLEGGPAVTGENVFSDVPEGQWYSEAVIWANQNNIVQGWNGQFSPNDPITRQDLATILWRYAKYKGYDVSVGEDTNILSWPDAFEVSEYAISAMQWATGEGIIHGSDGKLLPLGNAKRCEAAAMLMRFIESVK